MKQTVTQRSELAQALWSMRQVFYSAGIFSMFVNAFMLIPSIYMMQVYDRVLASRSGMTLLMLTGITLMFYLLLGVIERVRSELMIRASGQLDDKLSARVFSAVFDVSLLRPSQGNPAQALQDLTTLRQFLTGNGLFAFFDAPWAPIFLIVIALLHPLLGLLALAGALLLIALTLLNEKLTQQPLAEANQAAIGAQSHAASNLRNAEVIAAMGMLPQVQERWYRKHHHSLALQQRASDRAGSINAATRFVRLALQSLILGAGALLVIEDKLTAGAMIAASILMGRALAPVEQAIGTWKALVGARGAYERLQQILSMAPARTSTMSLPEPRGRVAVEQLSAAAPGSEEKVLTGVDFQLQPGEVVAVVGPSASGKSTLARLMVGVWPPAEGHVRLDGADVYEWDKVQLGKHIGYLPQDIELLEGTVAENIARFAEINAEEVVKAAQRAGIHDMILRFPKGYDTPIGVAGSFLSGGQRQRIALARALYGNPKLLVLDEPNSNLDDFGEAALVRAVKELRAQGSTVVIITHRSNIIGVVDKVLVLQEGRVRLFGPRTEVINALNGAAQQAAQQAAARHRNVSPTSVAMPAPVEVKTMA